MQQSEHLDLAAEALEAVYAEVMGGFPTLACSLLLNLSPSFLSTSGSRHEPMEVSMNAHSIFATGGFPYQTRFVLVNDRVPRTDRKCALCGKIVEECYVRDARTRLIYCDTQCLPGRVDMTKSVVIDCARKVS